MMAPAVGGTSGRPKLTLWLMPNRNGALEQAAMVRTTNMGKMLFFMTDATGSVV
jgi:hypothetical protein